MKFQKNTRRQPIDYEKDLVKYWKTNKTFEKSVENRPVTNAYVFYDGPPFITGLPHHGTLLSSVIKDAVPRYWTMKGKRVERTWGWDCHGLPAEVFTEKKLGISDRRDIGTKISLEDYIKACRANMVQTGSEWNDTIDRIGRWVDMEHAYKTMDKPYMESIWWAFKQLYDKNKIYEGEKVLLYCTRDATPISKAEVAMDNSYQDVTDPSVYVKFKLKNDDEHPVYLLAWTTTPWTLPSNTALAVNKDITYAEIELDGLKLILAEALLDKVITDEKHQVLDYKVIRTFKGKELIGKSYEPLLEDNRHLVTGNSDNTYKIWHADFVHTEEGTGIAHESPAYGEEDYILSKADNFPMFLNTDDEGFYTSGEWKGRQVWEVNKEIAKTLHERGIVWKIVYITHSYPHCHRCGTKLMYRAHPSWFMDIDGQRQEMLENNGDINWFPNHIKNGRFAKTVESAPDWNISRDRFWATAMPVWKGNDKDGKELIKVIGSYAELKELSGVELDDYHRPWIDDVTFTVDDVKYSRVDKVMDSWFEAGSMPFAQFHYPFENKDKFEANFPGDFIAEYVGQVRAWFYYLHAISTGIQAKNSFKNVIVTGTIAGNDGRKMSKQYGNYTDPNELMDKFSADALRFVYLSSPLLNGEDFALQDKDVSDISRKLAMVWNMYDFFSLYADVDGWEFSPSTPTDLPAGKAGSTASLSANSGLNGPMLTHRMSDTARSASPAHARTGPSVEGENNLPRGWLADPSPECQNPLDIWVISRLHQLMQEVDGHMQAYDLPNACNPIPKFIEDASNWYVRRSRKRFWKSEDDDDKAMAYRTLHYVLTQLAKVMAPFTPFLAEELYRNLTGEESVHLTDWPEAGHVNEMSLRSMDRTRQVIEAGLGARMQKNETEQSIKVRQPLSKLVYSGEKLSDELEEIIAEEVNVKKVERSEGQLEELITLDKTITPSLKHEGIAREVVRVVQNARKQADLQVDDRIFLSLTTDSKELAEAIKEHLETIKAETLATNFSAETRDYAYSDSLKIDGDELRLSLEKS